MMHAEVIRTKAFPALRVNGELQTGLAFYTVTDSTPEARRATAGRIAEFRDAGIHNYTFGLGLGDFMGQKAFWKGPGQYDGAVLDDLLGFVLSVDPAARILPRVAMDAPTWWKASHGDEIAIGWDRKRGLFREEWLQSFSSQPWRQDAGAALAEYIRYAEEKFSDHLLGYHVCAEASHEWSYGWWGSLHDYGPAQVSGFRAWLKQRHGGDVAALRRAWHDETVTFETAAIPSGESRVTGDYFEFFDSAKGSARSEYLEYHNWVVADAIRHFAAIAKESTGRQKLCGAFYGYYFFGENALLLDVGHRALAHVLASPDVDFIACPYNYRERHSGGVAITQSVASSIRLAGKLCYVEDDTRTCLAPAGAGWGRADTLADSVNILKRNWASAVTAGSSLWWMEQSPGWFSHPDVMATIGGMEALAHDLLEEAAQKGSPANTQIAVLVSDESARYMRYNTSLVEPLLNAFCVENLPRLGAPYDVFLTSDLERLAGEGLLEPYKLFVFLNTPFLDARQRRIIADKITCAGHTVLWIGCAGLISETGFSVNNVSALTGIALADEGYGGRVRLAVTDFGDEITQNVPRNLQFGTYEPTGPLLWCVDKAARHLGEAYCMPALGKDWLWKTGMLAGKTALAVKELGDWRSVWCGVPNPSSSLLRGIARKAGVHIYLDTDDVVYANARLLAVHTRYAGTRSIALPRPASVTDAFTREPIAAKADAFEARMERGATGGWLLEE